MTGTDWETILQSPPQTQETPTLSVVETHDFTNNSKTHRKTLSWTPPAPMKVNPFTHRRVQSLNAVSVTALSEMNQFWFNDMLTKLSQQKEKMNQHLKDPLYRSPEETRMHTLNVEHQVEIQKVENLSREENELEQLRKLYLSDEKTVVDAGKLTDRYGFFLKEENSATLTRSQSQQLTIQRKSILPFQPSTVSASKEAERSLKWVSMLESDPDATSSAWHRRLWKNVPDCMRARIWHHAWSHITAPDEMTLSEPHFHDLYSQPSAFDRQIDLDIERTMRDHIQFSTRYGLGQKSLFKVLCAYAQWRPDVGYCQGMAQVAAFLLLYFDEWNTFRGLVQLFQVWHLDRLYTVGFPLLFETFQLLEGLMQRHLPRLLKHFRQMQIETSAFATKWFLTLFLCCPHAFAVRIWDLFVHYGYDLLIYVALVLLETYQDTLLNADFEQVMHALQHIDSLNGMPGCLVVKDDQFLLRVRQLWKNPSHATKELNRFRQKT